MQPPLIASHMGYVTALDRDSGRVLWSRDVHIAAVPEKWRERTNVQLAVESPFVAVCVVGFTDSRVHTDMPGIWFYELLCFDEQSGAERWRVAGSAQGFGGEPAVMTLQPSLQLEQRRVYLSLQGVSAFTAEDGRLLWHSAVSPPAELGKKRNGWFTGTRVTEYWNGQLARRNQ